MDWKEHPPAPSPFERVAGINKEYTVHLAEYLGEDQFSSAAALDACLYAVLFIDKNIQPDSYYLLIGWDDMNSCLTIVVTTQDLQNDSHHVIKLCFEKLQEKLDNFEGSDKEYEFIASKNTRSIKSGIDQFVLNIDKQKLKHLKIAYYESYEPDVIHNLYG